MMSPGARRYQWPRAAVEVVVVVAAVVVAAAVGAGAVVAAQPKVNLPARDEAAAAMVATRCSALWG